jgi:hypothetical protein
MLVNKLQTVPALTELIAFVDDSNKKEAQLLLSDENNYDLVIKSIVKDDRLRAFCLPLLPEEKISEQIANNNKVRKHAFDNCEDESLPFKGVLDEIVKAGMQASLIREIKSTYGRIEHRKAKAAKKAAKTAKK